MSLVDVFALMVGLLMVLVTAIDIMSTLVVTTIGTSFWRPARLLYRYTWKAWRGFCLRFKDERLQDRWLGYYAPVSILVLLIVWLLLLSIGWALIYRAVLGQLHGAGDLRSLIYYSGSSLLTPSFGEVNHETALAGMLTLLETFMGIGTLALLISYLPVLYGAYNRREARLLTLDHPSGKRMTPLAAVEIYAGDGSLERLYAYFAEWELWTADILESHVSYPMLVYFRSQHLGQSWITALGLILDAATLVCATVPGTEAREPYFMFRRGQRAVNDIARRIHAVPGDETISRELFALAYERMRDGGLAIRDFDEAWERLRTMRGTYSQNLQGLFEYLAAPHGFWGHSAELD